VQVAPIAEGGMTRLKMVQKSLGVILGSLVEPKATSGRLRLTGTMRVGER